jgi:hypothetical protein
MGAANRKNAKNAVKRGSSSRLSKSFLKSLYITKKGARIDPGALFAKYRLMLHGAGQHQG